MITREQIKRHCANNHKLSYSCLLYATLDRDYQINDYAVPIGTIIELRLYTGTLADLYVNGKWINGCFPYDAATLLETEE